MKSTHKNKMTIQSSSSTSTSGSCSSSSYSLASTSLDERLKTIFKKAYELSTLCAVEVCVIYFGPNGELKTWPEERQIVKDIAFRYFQLDEKQRRKKSNNLYKFLNKKKKKKKDDNSSLSNKKAKKTNLNELKYLISDYSSPELTRSLEQSYSVLKERLRFIEARKEKQTELDHQETIMSLNHHQEAQFLNPNQFSVLIYNHEDNTFSQIPPSALNFNQSELCGYDPNMMCADNTFQHLNVSNTQDCSALLTSTESDLTNHLMQKELYGREQNSNNNFLDPYANGVVSSNLSSYGINFNLLPPSLTDSYLISDNSRETELRSSFLPQSQW